MPKTFTEREALLSFFGEVLTNGYYDGKFTSIFDPIDRIKEKWGSLEAWLSDCAQRPMKSAHGFRQIQTTHYLNPTPPLLGHSKLIEGIFDQSIYYVHSLNKGPKFLRQMIAEINANPATAFRDELPPDDAVDNVVESNTMPYKFRSRGKGKEKESRSVPESPKNVEAGPSLPTTQVSEQGPAPPPKRPRGRPKRIREPEPRPETSPLPPKRPRVILRVNQKPKPPESSSELVLSTTEAGKRLESHSAADSNFSQAGSLSVPNNSKSNTVDSTTPTLHQASIYAPSLETEALSQVKSSETASLSQDQNTASTSNLPPETSAESVAPSHSSDAIKPQAATKKTNIDAPSNPSGTQVSATATITPNHSPVQIDPEAAATKEKVDISSSPLETQAVTIAPSYSPVRIDPEAATTKNNIDPSSNPPEAQVSAAVNKAPLTPFALRHIELTPASISIIELTKAAFGSYSNYLSQYLLGHHDLRYDPLYMAAHDAVRRAHSLKMLHDQNRAEPSAGLTGIKKQDTTPNNKEHAPTPSN